MRPREEAALRDDEDKLVTAAWNAARGVGELYPFFEMRSSDIELLQLSLAMHQFTVLVILLAAKQRLTLLGVDVGNASPDEGVESSQLGIRVRISCTFDTEIEFRDLLVVATGAGVASGTLPNDWYERVEVSFPNDYSV